MTYEILERYSKFRTTDSPPEVLISRNGNVTSIEKPEGIYSVVYGLAFLPLNLENFPAKVDGVVIESPASNWSGVEPDSIMNWREDSHYGSLKRRLEADRIPVILADPTLNVATGVIPDLALLVGETAIGVRIFLEEARKPTNRNLSRRGFLKGALAGFLSLPTASIIGRVISNYADFGHEVTTKLTNFSYTVHPESTIFMITLRSVVLAEKIEWLMKNHFKGNPHIVVTLDALHSQLEKEIQTSHQNRLAFLNKLRPVLKQVIEQPETFYKIALFDFDKVWKVSSVLEIPELKELIS